MKTIQKIWLLFLLITAGLKALSQTRTIDSLRYLIKTESSAKQKLNLIYELAGQPINSDTLLPYVFIADSIASASKEKFNVSTAAYIRSYYYLRKNFVDSALVGIDKLIDEYKNDKQRPDFYLELLFFQAKIFDRGNRYTQALTQLYKVVQESENQKDTLTLIHAKTGIGWVQMEMEQYQEALNWFYKALNTSSNRNFYKNYGALYSNLASTYNSLHQPDSAQYYINLGIKDARENNNLYFLATSLSIQAKIFIDNNKTHLAEAPLNEAIQIRKELNDPFYTVYDMSSLASYYASNKQPVKGIELCKEGIVLAKEWGLSSQLLMIYHALAENYKATGDMIEYSKTLEDIIHLKDSFNNINSSRLLAEMQARNDEQKNQKEILQQKLNLTRKNYWLFGSVTLGLLLFSFGILFFKSYRKRQALKMEMALQKEKLNAVNAVKKAEENERIRIAADLHDNLGVYAASLSSNLNYIQQPEANSISEKALIELKSNSGAIVSELNDTIWVLKKEALAFTAISDRIKAFVNRIKKSYPEVSMEVKEDIMQDFTIPSFQAYHLYRVMQEAVNNSLKHSKGKNILVSIINDNAWQIMIEDDGDGFVFPINSVYIGNGIDNMRNRCREAGWYIQWIKKQEGGTIVKISPTTN